MTAPPSAPVSAVAGEREKKRLFSFSLVLSSHSTFSSPSSPTSKKKTKKNTKTALTSILRNEGVLALWRGAAPRAVWVAPLGAMNFAGYELAKRALERGSGGGESGGSGSGSEERSGGESSEDKNETENEQERLKEE